MRRALRRFTVKPQSRPNSEINVTPLVDVVLVLLIIFMVVTPLLEKDLVVRVPDAEQLVDPAELPADQLVVSVDASGALRLNAEVLGEGDYVARLRQVLDARPRGKRLVFFLAEEKTNYGRLVTALDGARLAGAEALGMMTERLEPPIPSQP
ncbi:MAG: biopolymer transporter ExbD [Myxococcaceae bacterium]|nr:biopolymer transporter ExbD [Myxococcaceae bacterium]